MAPKHGPFRRWAAEGATTTHGRNTALSRPRVGARRPAYGREVRPRSIVTTPVGRAGGHRRGASRTSTDTIPAPPFGTLAPVPVPRAPANQEALPAPPAPRPRPEPARRQPMGGGAQAPSERSPRGPAQSEKSEPNPSGPPLRTCRRRRRLPPDRVYCPNPKVQFCGPAAANERDDTGVRQVSGEPACESGPAAPAAAARLAAAPAARPGGAGAGGRSPERAGVARPVVCSLLCLSAHPQPLFCQRALGGPLPWQLDSIEPSSPASASSSGVHLRGAPSSLLPAGPGARNEIWAPFEGCGSTRGPPLAPVLPPGAVGCSAPWNSGAPCDALCGGTGRGLRVVSARGRAPGPPGRTSESRNPGKS